MFSNQQKILCLFLFCLASLPCTYAADRPIRVRIDLPLSTVTEKEEIGDDGSVTSVVGEEQIDKLNAQELTSALRRVPGVTISRYNPLGSYGGADGGSVYIRGHGSGRPGSEIRIYVNGAPLESGVWGHPLMDTVPVDFAEKITVFKGPQPQTYSGTFGSVNISTLERNLPGFETKINLGYGEFDTVIGNLTHGGKISGFNYYIGASHKQSEGHRPHADASLNAEYLRLGADISEENHLSYIVQATDNWSRDPGRIDRPIPVRDKFTTRTVSHVLRMDKSGKQVNGFSLFYAEDGTIRWAKDNLNGMGTPPGNSNTDWTNYGFRSSYDMLIGNFTLTGSLDYESKGGESQNVTVTGMVPFSFKGRFNTIAPYAGTRYLLELNELKLIPSAGIRFYKNSDFDSETAPCLSVTAEKNGGKIYVLYARGVNYPGVYAKGVSASTLSRLDAEVLDSVELGFHWTHSDKIALQASVFRYDSSNHLQSTPNGLLNIGRIKTNGGETSVHFFPGENLVIFLGLTFLKPDDELSPRMPGFSASAGISSQFMDHLNLSIDAQYVGSQYAYNGRSGSLSQTDMEEISDYLTANLKMSCDLSVFSGIQGECYMAVENLTDETYEYLPGYPMAGRNFSAGIKWKF
ncbi:MAG: TonB-dependent receptor plug domain-containing protein [Candidatus Aureabacteria bacterium]|nr:TonB-dependent receptor plug domain-containing protein [Candidatus Auribacterota bacterium]